MPCAHYLVVVKDVKHSSGITRGPDIVKFLLGRKIWIFPEYHIRRKLQLGDRLIIYLGGSYRAFVAVAKIASQAVPLASVLKEEIERLGLGWFTHSVKITNVRRLHPARPISRLLSRLGFISDKKNYGLSLRKGFRRVSDRDAQEILKTRKIDE